MKEIIFEPLDTLFFRNGRPFNQGEGTAGVESLFPPSPLTLVGAARAAWAKNKGWDGRSKWSDSIRGQLGGDGEELTGLQFKGPVLYRENEPLFPAPALLLGKVAGMDQPEKVVRLRPDDSKLNSDLGPVQFPVPEVDSTDLVEGRKLLAGWWLTQSGLKKVLAGSVPAPNDFVHQKQLWSMEPKVGNQIDEKTGATVEGMLYSTQHIRLKKDVGLSLSVEGDLADFPQAVQIPLGGEARSCWMSSRDPRPLLPAASVLEKDGILRYAIFVLTPIQTDNPPVPGEPFEGLPGRVISACLPRPQRWGGWDSIKFEPLPMKPHLATGSVVFVEADASDRETVLGLHGINIGERASWGFGMIAIGQWN